MVPVYNERESLPDLLGELRETLHATGLRHEIVVIDDGSDDGSGDFLEQEAANGNLRVIRFTRNRGKSAALARGFRESEGELIVTMDADLQDDPAEIPALLTKLDSGFDLVTGWKQQRKDSAGKLVASRLFNWVTRTVSGIPIHDFNCGLKVYRRAVVESVPLYGSLHRYLPVLAAQQGFRVAEEVVNHRPRKHGRSKFGRERYAEGLFDLMSVLFLHRYMQRPLHLFGRFGLLVSLSGVGVSGWTVFLKYGQGEPFRDHMALLTLGAILIIVGAQFISLGLLGEMIARGFALRGAEPPRPKGEARG